MSSLSFVSVYKLYLQVKSSRKTDDIIIVESLLNGNRKFSFSRAALHNFRGEIASLLSQIDDNMKQTYSSEPRNGYWIMARYNWRVLPWTESLDDVDLLLSIGRAAGMVQLIYPAEKNSFCDMPHAVILDVDSRRQEQLLPEESQIWRLKYWNFSYLRI